MLPVRIGLELEFVADSSDLYNNEGGYNEKGHLIVGLREALAPLKVTILQDNVRRNIDTDWQLGQDGSALNAYWLGNGSVCEGLKRYTRACGYELRSPIIVKETKHSHWEALKAMLGVLNENACISRTCGMHVHVSSPTERASVVGSSMSLRILKAYGDETWVDRQRYCMRGYSTTGKYHTVFHPGGNHVEFRLFNGTLSFEEVDQRIDAVVDAYRRGLRYRGRNGLGRKLATRVRLSKSRRKVAVS